MTSTSNLESPFISQTHWSNMYPTTTSSVALVGEYGLHNASSYHPRQLMISQIVVWKLSMVTIAIHASLSRIRSLSFFHAHPYPRSPLALYDVRYQPQLFRRCLSKYPGASIALPQLDWRHINFALDGMHKIKAPTPHGIEALSKKNIREWFERQWYSLPN